MKMKLSQKIIDDLAELGFKDTQSWTLAQAIEALQESGLEKWYYKILISLGGIVVGVGGLIVAILK